MKDAEEFACLTEDFAVSSTILSSASTDDLPISHVVEDATSARRLIASPSLSSGPDQYGPDRNHEIRACQAQLPCLVHSPACLTDEVCATNIYTDHDDGPDVISGIVCGRTSTTHGKRPNQRTRNRCHLVQHCISLKSLLETANDVTSLVPQDSL